SPVLPALPRQARQARPLCSSAPRPASPMSSAVPRLALERTLTTTRCSPTSGSSPRPLLSPLLRAPARYGCELAPRLRQTKEKRAGWLAED
ncbi:hypothetical protein HK405_002351, partial [Cladochytrium tenue]